MAKGTGLQRQVESRLYISRPLKFEKPHENDKIEDFANKVGRAIKGMGRTRSLGSMAVTLLSAQQYSQVRNNLTVRDRNRLSGKFDDFARGLEEALQTRPDAAVFAIKGLGFWGRNPRSRQPGVWTTFGFNAAPDGNQAIIEDIDLIKSYFSNQQLPEPSINPKKLHISAGEVQIYHLASGKPMDKEDGPSIFIPAGVVIPTRANLQLPHAEIIEG